MQKEKNLFLKTKSTYKSIVTEYILNDIKELNSLLISLTTLASVYKFYTVFIYTNLNINDTIKSLDIPRITIKPYKQGKTYFPIHFEETYPVYSINITKDKFTLFELLKSSSITYEGIFEEILTFYRTLTSKTPHDRVTQEVLEEIWEDFHSNNYKSPFFIRQSHP